MIHSCYQTITCLPPSPGSWVSDPDFRPEVTCPPLWSPDPPPSLLIPFPPLKQMSEVTCVPLWSLNPPVPFHLSKRSIQERISLSHGPWTHLRASFSISSSWSLDTLPGWLNPFLQWFLRLVPVPMAPSWFLLFTLIWKGKGHKPLHVF